MSESKMIAMNARKRKLGQVAPNRESKRPDIDGSEDMLSPESDNPQPGRYDMSKPDGDEGDVPNEHDQDMRRAAHEDGLQSFSKGGSVSPSGRPSPEYNDEFDQSGMNDKNNAEGQDEHLDNEPMGGSWESDEFLADPYGDMTGNAHSSFDPELENTNRRGRLQRVMNSVQRMHKRGGNGGY